MSYITLKTIRVKELCEKYIEKRVKQLIESQEPLIQKTMKGGLFKKAKTREEAIEYLNLNASIWSQWHLIRLAGIGDDTRAHELLKACSLNPYGEINLDIRDAAILSSVRNVS